MLKIKNLNSGYNDFEVLHGVNFEVKPGEIVAVIGPNGSGKSTLLKSIFNLCQVGSGKIGFNGKDITKLPTHELIHLGVGYVPQGRQVFGDLTIKENLEMGAFIVKDKELVGRNLDYVFEKFPFLKERRKSYAFELSGGQQQILAIGRALMQNPQLLLMDEPSLGLSPKASKEIFEKIKEIRAEGIGVILVEQNAKQAVEIADRTYVLENGKVVLSGGKDILKNKKIKEIYLGGM
jgi:branched-chain amino acid transport system ATP-binding protein